MTEHIVAVFDNDGPAAAAERALGDAGIPASAVRRYTTSEAGAETTTTSEQSSGGFWSWLLGEETPRYPDYDKDMAYYERRARAGSTILSVTIADDSQIHRAVEIIESYHPVEIDERADEDDADSATRVGASTAGRDFSSGATTSPAATTSASAGQTSAAMTGGMTTDTASTTRDERQLSATKDREETISLSEEEIEVGKRTVDRGATRIRRYVVETPVERQVSLHGERVTIERRRPVEGTAPGTGAFEERVVEVRETEEVPVVRKTAHVAEEVVVHREDTERTETVRDTVRREEVEVTDDKTGTTSGTGTTTGTGSTPGTTKR